MQTHDNETGKIFALTAMADNFGKEMPETLLDMWLELLVPYSSALVHQAVKTVIETYEFKTMPPFAVLKRALDDISGTSEEATQLQALSEWGVLLETIDRVGFYGRPVLHATTAYVVRLFGGWGTVCNWPEKGMEFRRKEFITYWTQAHGRADKMAFGAAAVQYALGEKRNGAVTVGQGIGHAIAALESGEVQQ